MPPCSPPCSGSPSSECPSQEAPTAAPVLCHLKRSLLTFEVLIIVIILWFKCETGVNLTEKFAAGARWWRRRWKHLRTILLWKIISRISKALTGVDICVSCTCLRMRGRLYDGHRLGGKKLQVCRTWPAAENQLRFQQSENITKAQEWPGVTKRSLS